MSKNITIRIYNSTKNDIDRANQFTWCGDFFQQPPATIRSGAVGVCVIQRPSGTDAVGGAVVYRMDANDCDVVVAFDNPSHGAKTLAMTKIGEKNQFTDGTAIHDALWAAKTNFSQDSDSPSVISLAAITTDGQATCMAVVGDRDTD